MTRYLLDTSIALIAAGEPEKLTEPVRAALLSKSNVISVVSYWEVVIKSVQGKLDVGEPALWWSQTLSQLKAGALLLRPEHVAALSALPALHQDPFDRILIAQARVAGLTLLTTDLGLEGYATGDFKVLR